MVFEEGKCYKHTTGSMISIIGKAETWYHGKCLIGENEMGELSPCGMSEENAINYVEVLKEEFCKKGDREI